MAEKETEKHCEICGVVESEKVTIKQVDGYTPIWVCDECIESRGLVELVFQFKELKNYIYSELITERNRLNRQISTLKKATLKD